MDGKKPQVDDNSEIIMLDDLYETVVVRDSSPEKKPLCPQAKPKKRRMRKQNKRKVKLRVDQQKEIETLLITQKVQVKQTKIRCVININTVCKGRRSDSIIRFDRNVWKKEAYYDRTVPVCSRTHCFSDSIYQADKKSDIRTACCRSARNRECFRLNSSRKLKSLSPVSSVALTELENNNISYEDVSNGNFSSSEEELDTLIRRTKEREKRIYSHRANVYSAPLFASTPAPHEDIVSSDMSLHSVATLVLAPLDPEAYSPNSPNNVPGYTPYSPTMSPDFIEMDHQDISPYSPTDPTVTPPRDTEIKVENGATQYSYDSLSLPIFEREDNKNSVFVANPKIEPQTEAEVIREDNKGSVFVVNPKIEPQTEAEVIREDNKGSVFVANPKIEPQTEAEVIREDNKGSVFVANPKIEPQTEAKVIQSFPIKIEKTEVKSENENESDVNANFKVLI